MRAVVQRVSSASVTIDGRVTAEISRGLLVLLGVHHADSETDATWLAQKIAALRIFEDASGKMNLSVADASSLNAQHSSLNPPVLVVSQFTLLASTRKGTRPSFNDAAHPDVAVPLYELFNRLLSTELGHAVATGTFGAMMQVALVNDGPVTIILDSRLRE